MPSRPISRTETHKHVAVTKHVLSQRLGVPYEVERRFCADCRRVLAERPLRRAAA
jgi:NMD protein affecting ribosome stability and mRNA decay